jgi:hypothetical protein
LTRSFIRPVVAITFTITIILILNAFSVCAEKKVTGLFTILVTGLCTNRFIRLIQTINKTVTAFCHGDALATFTQEALAVWMATEVLVRPVRAVLWKSQSSV